MTQELFRYTFPSPLSLPPIGWEMKNFTTPSTGPFYEWIAADQIQRAVPNANDIILERMSTLAYVGLYFEIKVVSLVAGANLFLNFFDGLDATGNGVIIFIPFSDGLMYADYYKNAAFDHEDVIGGAVSSGDVFRVEIRWPNVKLFQNGVQIYDATQVYDVNHNGLYPSIESVKSNDFVFGDVAGGEFFTPTKVVLTNSAAKVVMP